MFIFVTCDVSPFAGFAWFLARAVLNTFLFISCNICLGAQKNCLIETILLSAHNICFWFRKKKIIHYYLEAS